MARKRRSSSSWSRDTLAVKSVSGCRRDKKKCLHVSSNTIFPIIQAWKYQAHPRNEISLAHSRCRFFFRNGRAFMAGDWGRGESIKDSSLREEARGTTTKHRLDTRAHKSRVDEIHDRNNTLVNSQPKFPKLSNLFRRIELHRQASFQAE